MTARSRHLLLLGGAMLLLFFAGCQVAPRDASRPRRTKLGSPLVVLPVENLGNYLVVTAKWDRHGPYRFLVDTGSSVTHVSPEIAERYRVKNAPPTGIPPVRVQSASGEVTVLPSATIERIELGDARFEDVPVLIYDCAALSAHLGIKIDGILGFPLFREAKLTLDYPNSRLILAPAKSNALSPGDPIPYTSTHGAPLISIGVGKTHLAALVDSGSDAALNLNPAGLNLTYSAPPRPAVLVGTLTGDHLQESARINEPLTLGQYTLNSPIVYLNDNLNSIGGEVLKNFSVTFDQEKKTVSFQREARGPITMPAKRSTGLSFSKTPAYWRVAGVVPDSPATWADVKAGDLISRINGEPVAAWDYQRYAALIASADKITYTFLRGTAEEDRTLSVFLLVP